VKGRSLSAFPEDLGQYFGLITAIVDFTCSKRNFCQNAHSQMILDFRFAILDWSRLLGLAYKERRLELKNNPKSKIANLKLARLPGHKILRSIEITIFTFCPDPSVDLSKGLILSDRHCPVGGYVGA
jgi:hypothetical protein